MSHLIWIYSATQSHLIEFDDMPKKLVNKKKKKIVAIKNIKITGMNIPFVPVIVKRLLGRVERNITTTL